ncbi:MAG: transglutaminase-like domain-containing protein [Pseudomonadota bacterium]
MMQSYDNHSPYSDPITFRSMIRSWPLEPRQLADEISRYLFHVGSEECQAVFSPHLHLDDMRARSVTDILSRSIESGHQSEARKCAGVCRDFALLAVSAYRSHGTPARLRVGFADYFTQDFLEDHWVCEFHDGKQWRLLDVEVVAEPGISLFEFDAADVPSDRFIKAADAWKRVQSGEISYNKCGVHRLNITGEWFAAANVFRDAAALSGIELKPWDYWGENAKFEISDDLASEPCRAAASLLAEKIPELETPRSSFLIEAFKNWLPRKYVTSFPDGEPETVQLLRD